MQKHEIFMQRCLQLATLGAGHVAPNPMVGAVLVYDDRIIGEGYHKKYGDAHAEVNCINSVASQDAHLICKSVLYVSLEPCNHYGKTPPCTALILNYKIAKVVIGCQDSFTKVNGKGIEKLKQNGVHVTVGIMEEECRKLNKRFFTFHAEHRPFIILKWSETADNKIAFNSDKRLLISGNISNKIVHKWRSEEAGILVGTRTADVDNPSLTNRLWNGTSLVRVVLDLDLRLKKNLKVFSDQSAPTIILNREQQTANFDQALKKQVYYVKVDENNLILNILNACYKLKIQSLLVEGGRKMLQSFIDENIWDEIRIITNNEMRIGHGLYSPTIDNATLTNTMNVQGETLSIYKK